MINRKENLRTRVGKHTQFSEHKQERIIIPIGLTGKNSKHKSRNFYVSFLIKTRLDTFMLLIILPKNAPILHSYYTKSLV